MASAPDPARSELERLARSGIDALRRGDGIAARSAFDAVVASGRATLQIFLLLAQACEMLGDDAAEHRALDAVLGADGRNPHALVMKGDLFAAAGDDRAAVGWYGLALSSVAGATGLPDDLTQRLRHAEAARAAAATRFAAAIEAGLARAGVTAPEPRLAEALAILSGNAQPQLQQPTSFYYPRLPQIPFYDTTDFEWVAALEAAAPAIAAEALAVLAGRDGVAAYVEADPNRPNRGHSLLGDPRWSAFHLWKGGEPVTANAARCPATITALAALPIPHIRARSPMALFSILAPHTHIPPHHGMLNTRLICHLPLVVPPHCRLRVGNETRNVEAGKMLIFDDSIEHEAWNDSDEPRAILLFEVWRPELSGTEIKALTAIFESVGDYGTED